MVVSCASCTAHDQADDCDDHATPVYANIYDMSERNGLLKALGLGIFHCSIEVGGSEYFFAGADDDVSGIDRCPPRMCPLAECYFREQVFIGRTPLTPPEVRMLLSEMSVNYRANTYNLITRNCNHFASELSVRLTGLDIPPYVNRAARSGARFTAFFDLSQMDASAAAKQARDREAAAARGAKTRGASLKTIGHMTYAVNAADPVM